MLGLLERIKNLFVDRTFGAKRSGEWNLFRKEHIKDYCEIHGGKGTLLNPLQLHHEKPFHLFPELELDPENVVTACWFCHFWFCHLGSFKSYNLEIKRDIQRWQRKRELRP